MARALALLALLWLLPGLRPALEELGTFPFPNPGLVEMDEEQRRKHAKWVCWCGSPGGRSESKR